MQRLIFIYLALFLPLLFSCSSEKKSNEKEEKVKNIISPSPDNSQEQPQRKNRPENVTKVYQLESGIVEYESTVQGEEVLEVMYFDDWGNKEARYTYTKQNGELQSVSIIDENVIYMVDDVVQKIGSKMARPNKKAVFMFDELVEKFGDEQQARKFLKENNITVKEEKENILGYPCEVRVTKKGNNYTVTSWLYKRVILKAQSELVANGKKVTTGSTATKFKPDASIGADKFKLPRGIRPQDLKDMGDLLKKNWQ